MPVWPFLLGLSALVFGLAIFAKNAPAMKIAGVILCAYIAGRAVKSMGIDYTLSAFAIIWLVASLSVLLIDARRYGISALLLGVSVCYLWAKVTAAPWVFGSIPFVISDALAVLAMIALGAGLRHDIIGRVSDMGRHWSDRGFSLGLDRGIVAQKVERKKAG